MKTIDIDYFPHCTDEDGCPGCDLGSADYECPDCTKQSSDYEDLWWDQDKPKGHVLTTKCEHCNSEFTLKKIDYNTYEVLVKS